MIATRGKPINSRALIVYSGISIYLVIGMVIAVPEIEKTKKKVLIT